MNKICQLLLSLPLCALAGCGGGSGTLPAAAANKAVVFGAVDSFGNLTGVANGIRGIQVAATLPPGVFPSISSGRLLRIGETGLKSLKGNAFIPFGRYSATTRQVIFAVIANPIDSSIGVGDFARLTYQTAPGTAVSANGFETSYEVAGPNGNDLSARVSPAVKLVSF